MLAGRIPCCHQAFVGPSSSSGEYQAFYQIGSTMALGGYHGQFWLARPGGCLALGIAAAGLRRGGRGSSHTVCSATWRAGELLTYLGPY